MYLLCSVHTGIHTVRYKQKHTYTCAENVAASAIVTIAAVMAIAAVEAGGEGDRTAATS